MATPFQKQPQIENDYSTKHIAFSIIISKQPKTLTKQLSLDSNNRLAKTTVANVTDSIVKSGCVASAAGLAEQLQKLGHNCALLFGVPKGCDPYGDKLIEQKVLSRKKFIELGQPADAITRTKENFEWPAGAGVLMLDYDPQDGSGPLDREQLLEQLGEVMPEIASCAYVWWCSSSSLIFNTKTQEQIAGAKGQRVYVLVKDARDIERAGKVLFDRLWLAGYGYYAVSSSGSALERSIIDASVWQPTRLDFASGAQCVEPLEQRRGEPVVHEGQLLDTAEVLPDLNASEAADLKAAKQRALEQVQEQIDAVRAEYISARASELITAKYGDKLAALSDEESERAYSAAEELITRACERHVLDGDFIITLAGGKQVTVAEVLDKPSDFHGKETLDPLEPEYCNNKIVGRLYLFGGRPNLYSQAHGGRNFKLIRATRRIEHVKGSTSETTHKTLEYLRELPDVFDYGHMMAHVQGGQLVTFNRDSLSFWLGGVVQFWRWAKTPNGGLYEDMIDPPGTILNQLLAIGLARGLKPIKAVITAPIMAMDGRILKRAGYDKQVQLYLDMSSEPLPVPDHVDEQKALDALDVLMRPFRGFKFASALDRSVMLAALLTAIQRPVLSTAPAIGFDAPVQGTGKTLLAQCIGALCTGEVPGVYPHTAGRDDEEIRKRLTAILSNGDRVIIWDNVLGHFDSASIASFLTSPVLRDRILGRSEVSEMPNRAMLIITGNNLSFAGDMPRRVLNCRLDTGMANPSGRRFDFNPLTEVLSDRQKLAQAALTLMRGYRQSEAFKEGGAGAGSTASFEDWDGVVRQPAAWIASLLPEQYRDPAEALQAAIADDPERAELGEMLEGIEVALGRDQWFTARELFDALVRPAGGGHPELLELCESLTHGRLSARGLGRVLGYRVDRIANDMRLAKARRGDKLSFKLERLAPRQNSTSRVPWLKSIS